MVILNKKGMDISLNLGQPIPELGNYLSWIEWQLKQMQSNI